MTLETSMVTPGHIESSINTVASPNYHEGAINTRGPVEQDIEPMDLSQTPPGIENNTPDDIDMGDDVPINETSTPEAEDYVREDIPMDVVEREPRRSEKRDNLTTRTETNKEDPTRRILPARMTRRNISTRGNANRLTATPTNPSTSRQTTRPHIPSIQRMHVLNEDIRPVRSLKATYLAAHGFDPSEPVDVDQYASLWDPNFGENYVGPMHSSNAPLSYHPGR